MLQEKLRLENKSKALDLGTGKGRFARHFASRGCDCVAVDLNREMLNEAGRLAALEGVADKINFVQAPVDEFLDSCKDSYDIVSAMEFLDHYPDVEGLFAHANRLLAPGGLFVVSYVSSISLYGLLFRLVMKKVKASELRVARPYDPSYINELYSSHGFDFHSYGVGIGTIILRETLNPLVQMALSIPIKTEGALKPYFSSRFFAERCVHVMVVGVKR